MTSREEMREAVELLPCPFCGSDDLTVNANSVECGRCDAEARVPWVAGMDGDEAIAAWNIRASTSPNPDLGEGWLIEGDMPDGSPGWLTLKPAEALWGIVLTKESGDAVRFARRADAEDYFAAHIDEGPYRITEHRWDAPPLGGGGEVKQGVMASVDDGGGTSPVPGSKSDGLCKSEGGR